MIPCLNAPQPALSWTSPFSRGQDERPIKLTFHYSTLVGLPDEELAALEALYELCHLPEVDQMHTEDGPLPSINISDSIANYDGYLVGISDENGPRDGLFGGIQSRDQWPGIATGLVGGGAENSPNAKAMLNDLIIAQAHCTLSRDILVTTSRWLLDRRTRSWVQESNPHLPSEAAKILGLFLRSHDNFTYKASEMSAASFDQGMFYWVLIRHRLPSMWRYFSACHYAGDARGDDTFDLAQSIFERCVRATKARDAIGERFYQARARATIDDSLYHFDYLSLLLAGALDAQARIAHRAYHIIKPEERRASFRSRAFKNALVQHGAEQLYDLVSSREFEALTTLIYQLRNTIHGAGAKDLVERQSGTTVDAGFAHLSEEVGKKLCSAAGVLGSPEGWGLRQRSISLLKPPNTEIEHVEEYLAEPFTYSISLLKESFKMIDKVATLTDVEKLFPYGYSIPELMEKPSANGVFQKEIRERIDILA